MFAIYYRIGNSALLIVNNYILRNWFIYLFDSHSKDENDSLLSSGATVSSKRDTLHSLENYIISVYYNTSLMTLYFKLQFIKVNCTVHAKSAIKCLLKIVSKLEKEFESSKKKISWKSRKEKTCTEMEVSW